ncbi:response regulator [Aquirhabdus parva]|uniref:Response regulator n=1 Tax=Aquirhabdus parva TaxID=2283318 RepID=A0A345P2S8_9GAMM|nr:response regulator [Aquirhabdus parva]AXI01587.1 response regulator [Aquirhabdus parva]
MAYVMVVEDEKELASLIEDYLRHAGFDVGVYHDGQRAFDVIHQKVPDLIVLDIMLPRMDGITMCHAIRQFSEVPIIMVTARSEEIDRLLGLRIGADDYLCKPFSPRELVARVQAVLRRYQYGLALAQENSTDLGFKVDELGRRVLFDGKPLLLTPYEYNLLSLFIKNAGRVYSRAQLLDHLSPDSIDVADRVIDSHIKNLRRKLSEAAKRTDQYEWIQSIYGVGYRFEWPESS